MDEKRKSNRRVGQRIAKPSPMLVFWEGPSGRFEADLYDIGIGGCFLNTAGEAEMGERIVVEVPRPTAEASVVSFDGMVVPQTRQLKGFGVRFLALTDEQASVIGLFTLRSQEIRERRHSRRS
jgi:hypothetical protein